MSQSPAKPSEFEHQSGYADAARQLNKLVRSGRSYSGHERNCCFLNVAGQRFANVSMVSGFDFAEDGRAVAVCDWDGDGDQDFWVANRTAPQLRLMRNELADPATNNFVKFRLQGTRSNRDAIGARVTLQLDPNGGPSTCLQRTLRAGEGFLACHSKQIHFGLGSVEQIATVQVRWPSGATEDFGGLQQVSRTWLLVEGSGKPVPVTTVPDSLDPATAAARGPILPDQSLATCNWITEPVPMPPLLFETFDGSLIDAAATRDKPLLINLWASWCQPCLLELAEWQTTLPNEHVDVLPISVDGLSVDGQAATEITPAELQTQLQRMGFQGKAGIATPQLLDTLQLVHNVVYDHHRTLPVPCSFLLDRQGALRAIYKGRVSAARIVADAKSIRTANADQQSGLPFKGTWLGAQGTHNLTLLVEELFREGYETEANAYVERLDSQRLRAKQVKARLFLAEQLGTRDPATAIRHASEVLKIAPQNATAHERMALLLVRSGKTDEALQHFRAAATHATPPVARTHFNYGRLLRKTKDTQQAVVQFKRAVEIDPNFAPAYEQLGLVLASAQQFTAAVPHFQKAAQLQPENDAHRVNLAMALLRIKQEKAAWTVLSPVVEKQTAPPTALLMGARALELQARYEEAIPLLERFLKTEPNAKDVQQQLDRLRKRASQSPSTR